MNEHRSDAEKGFSAPEHADNTAPYNQALTEGELKKAIDSLGSASKASGKDPISYHMVRRFTPLMNNVLLRFYQACWQSGSIPKAWKDALVVAIPKDGKPRHLPTSYRPIELTPHLGKLYERIVKARLEHFLETQGILPVCQAGFRKQRSCMEQVVRLIEKAKKNDGLPAHVGSNPIRCQKSV